MNQIRLLSRTFFVRLFESDLMPPGLPQVQLVIWSVVLVATPVLTLPGVYAYKYTGLWARHGTLGGAIAVDRLVLITLAMIAAGLVAIMTWENALPDRRDVRILGVLPIGTRVFVTARLLALAKLFGLFFATLGVIPSVLFAVLAWCYLDPGSLTALALAQLIAALTGALAAFCAVIAVQSLTVRTLGRGVAQRAANLIQVLFAIALVQMILFLPAIGSRMTDWNVAPDWPSSNPVAWLPSVWYLGLFEVLAGHDGPNAVPLAAWATAGTVVSVAAALGIYALAYRAMAVQALESAAPENRWPAWLRRAAGGQWIARPVSGRRAIAAAVRQFTIRTLSRSRQHRTLLALYVGLGLALVISSILPLAIQRGFSAFAKPGVAVLSAPLVLIFVALVGMRVAFAIPVEIRANWVVRLGEPADTNGAVEGVLAAMLAWGVIPFAVIGGLGAGILWGAAVGAQHALVAVILGWLLAEVLVVRLCKIPFTCTYMPGRSEVKTLWPFYFTAFTTFSYSTAALELTILTRPRSMTVFLIVMSAVALGARIYRQRSFVSEPGLRFTEEEPGALFEGFHLSEGLAARPQARIETP